jgi:hypothetical protein
VVFLSQPEERVPEPWEEYSKMAPPDYVTVENSDLPTYDEAVRLDPRRLRLEDDILPDRLVPEYLYFRCKNICILVVLFLILQIKPFLEKEDSLT